MSVPARRANSATADSMIHSSRACCRRAPEMTPSSWSPEQPGRPEPSSPVTVSTMVPNRGPGRIVSAAPPWQNPDRVNCSGGRHTYKPCPVKPGSSSSSAEGSSEKPPGSSSSPGGLENRSWGTNHRPFGRIQKYPLRTVYLTYGQVTTLSEYLFCLGESRRRSGTPG